MWRALHVHSETICLRLGERCTTRTERALMLPLCIEGQHYRIVQLQTTSRDSGIKVSAKVQLFGKDGTALPVEYQRIIDVVGASFVVSNVDDAP